ncbi:hypothetical protein PVAND_015894 [Polypedilum vanderplanki]|uniref:Uncharacterized protein n=1 Tax=Polypedilum vanderplanki TaxID=319348 RepID=A0A9J6BDG9_POLVA|nr:hypothetical protein PVAND_015894 [Polypedilum vanderplanki]
MNRLSIFLLFIPIFTIEAWRIGRTDASLFSIFPPMKYEDTSVTCNFNIIPPSSLWLQTEVEYYSCDVQTDFTYSNLRVNAITENHMNGKTNDDVKVLIIDGRQMNFVPFNFENFFPNLIGIKIDGTDLMYIGKNDLSPFTKLEYLEVTNSQIQVIFKDSFAMNTKLKSINLLGNPILYIDRNVFDSLNDLSYLYLSTTVCMMGTTDAETTAAVANLKTLITQNCGNTNFMLRTVADLYESIRNNDNCEPFECPVTEEPCEIEECDKECLDRENVLMKNLTQITKDLNTCEGEKDELQKDIQPLQEKLDDCLNPVNGTCRFRDVSDVYGYSCLANNVKIEGNETIEWKGQHSGNFNDSQVQTLIISYQSTKNIPKNPAKAFVNLKTFVIENCKLERIQKSDFNDLSKIERLEIIGNSISIIESGSFDVLTVLTYLDLSNNNLNSLPGKAFDKLNALLILNLSKNKLTSLRFDLISSSPKITHFYANDNSLSTMDINFVWRLQKASIIDLSGNDCDLKFDKIENLSASFIGFFNRIIENC